MRKEVVMVKRSHTSWPKKIRVLSDPKEGVWSLSPTLSTEDIVGRRQYAIRAEKPPGN